MIQSFISSAMDQISLLRIADAVDIVIVAVIIYFLLKFMRDSRTVRLLKGIIMIIVAVQVVYMFNLHVTSYIVSKCAQLGVIALVVVFQPELRRALDQVGKTSFSGMFSTDTEKQQKTLEMIKEVSHAAQAMSNTRTGALIVIERGTGIDSLISSGIRLDSEVSSELLVNIFVPNTPLHDGAVVIRDNRIALATCVLPLSQNPQIATELGTRHRAGIGISEESDVVVVIVSEETGMISIANKGLLRRGYTEDTAQSALENLLVEPEDARKGSHIRNIFGRKTKDAK